MMVRKFVRIIIVLLLTFAVVIGLISIEHPIILKWISGTAECIGKPIDASVYTNGQINHDLKVFRVDWYWESNKQANNYLLNLPEYDSLGRLRFININLNEKWIGMPVAVSKKDYDFIFGRLFQSETGGHFIPFHDDIKGFGYDPELTFNGKQIQFNTPPTKLKFDSIRIELE